MSGAGRRRWSGTWSVAVVAASLFAGCGGSGETIAVCPGEDSAAPVLIADGAEQGLRASTGTDCDDPQLHLDGDPVGPTLVVSGDAQVRAVDVDGWDTRVAWSGGDVGEPSDDGTRSLDRFDGDGCYSLRVTYESGESARSWVALVQVGPDTPCGGPDDVVHADAECPTSLPEVIVVVGEREVEPVLRSASYCSEDDPQRMVVSDSDGRPAPIVDVADGEVPVVKWSNDDGYATSLDWPVGPTYGDMGGTALAVTDSGCYLLDLRAEGELTPSGQAGAWWELQLRFGDPSQTCG